MGPLLRSSAEVHTAIELAFGVVSGVGPGIYIRWGSTCLKGKGLFLAWFLAFYGICTPICLNGRNDINVFDSCVKS